MPTSGRHDRIRGDVRNRLDCVWTFFSIVVLLVVTSGTVLALAGLAALVLAPIVALVARKKPTVRWLLPTGLALLGVVSLAGAFALAGAHTSAATHRAWNTARLQLDHIHAEDLGDVLGHGAYGSTGLSGGPPTAFVAVQTDVPTASLMATIGTRMQQAGFTPSVRCRPPDVCIWDQRVDNTLITARAFVLVGGQQWGEKSMAHGTVAPGSRVLGVWMIVGG